MNPGWLQFVTNQDSARPESDLIDPESGPVVERKGHGFSPMITDLIRFIRENPWRVLASD
jgi:hypothetical protein